MRKCLAYSLVFATVFVEFVAPRWSIRSKTSAGALQVGHLYAAAVRNQWVQREVQVGRPSCSPTTASVSKEHSRSWGFGLVQVRVAATALFGVVDRPKFICLREAP